MGISYQRFMVLILKLHFFSCLLVHASGDFVYLDREELDFMAFAAGYSKSNDLLSTVSYEDIQDAVLKLLGHKKFFDSGDVSYVLDQYNRSVLYSRAMNILLDLRVFENEISTEKISSHSDLIDLFSRKFNIDLRGLSQSDLENVFQTCKNFLAGKFTILKFSNQKILEFISYEKHSWYSSDKIDITSNVFTRRYSFQIDKDNIDKNVDILKKLFGFVQTYDFLEKINTLGMDEKIRFDIVVAKKASEIISFLSQEEGIFDLKYMSHASQILIEKAFFKKIKEPRFVKFVSDEDCKIIAKSFYFNENITYKDIQRRFFDEMEMGHKPSLLHIHDSKSFTEKIVNLVQNRKIKFEEILQKYPDLKKFIELHGKCFPLVFERFFNKNRSDIARIINRTRGIAVISKYNLEKLWIPKKFICLGGPYRATIFAASYADSFKYEKQISLGQAKDLIVFVEKTGFQDWGGNTPANVKWSASGKIALIDTEDKSFKSHGRFSKGALINQMIERLGRYMTDEALRFVKERAKDLNEKGEDGYVVPLPDNPEYDPEDMNFANISKQYDDFLGELISLKV